MGIMLCFVAVMGIILLGCMWFLADAGIPAKAGLTLLFFISCGLVLVNSGIAMAALALLCIIMGAMSFGLEWLT